MYAETLRQHFPDLAPVVDDLFLLEPHQIADLPVRAPRSELGVVLRARPDVVRFLVARCPSIESYATDVVNEAASAPGDLSRAADGLLWRSPISSSISVLPTCMTPV